MSQCDQVLNHMKRHGSITPMQAFSRYQITCLAERVRDARDKGHQITKVWVKRNGKRYAKYSLATKRPDQC